MFNFTGVHQCAVCAILLNKSVQSLLQAIMAIKALKELGSFSGDGDVDEWLDHFETALHIDRLEAKEADMLVMQLVGPAFAIWKGSDADA